MGGDHGPSVTVPASIKVLEENPELTLLLVGQSEVLNNVLKQYRYDPNRLIVQPASQVVGMDELPSMALRGKKDSSMRVAIDLVKSKKAVACVSAGNTGALMATARFVLKTLPGVKRPAITTLLPSDKVDCHVRILDLGANIDSSAELLFQFAVMGSVMAEAIDNIDRPRVSLLNIGEEDIKGNEQVKKTALMLQASTHINFVGYIEGNRVFSTDTDVVVCDGFVGNIGLKCSEGLANLIIESMLKAFRRNLFSKLVGLLALPILKKIKKRIDPEDYNGASLVGLQGIVIKSHGRANEKAFSAAIRQAVRQAKQNIPQRLHERVQKILEDQTK